MIFQKKKYTCAPPPPGHGASHHSYLFLAFRLQHSIESYKFSDVMFIQKFLLCRKAYCAFRIANIHQYQYSVHFAHLPCHPTQHPTQHVNATVHVQVQVQSYRHSKPEFLIPKLHQVQSYRPPSSELQTSKLYQVQSYRKPCSELQDTMFRITG